MTPQFFAKLVEYVDHALDSELHDFIIPPKLSDRMVQAMRAVYEGCRDVIKGEKKEENKE